MGIIRDPAGKLQTMAPGLPKLPGAWPGGLVRKPVAGTGRRMGVLVRLGNGHLADNGRLLLRARSGDGNPVPGRAREGGVARIKRNARPPAPTYILPRQDGVPKGA